MQQLINLCPTSISLILRRRFRQYEQLESKFIISTDSNISVAIEHWPEFFGLKQDHRKWTNEASLEAPLATKCDNANWSASTLQIPGNCILAMQLLESNELILCDQGNQISHLKVWSSHITSVGWRKPSFPYFPFFAITEDSTSQLESWLRLWEMISSSDSPKKATKTIA